jgi:hypothetical protein
MPVVIDLSMLKKTSTATAVAPRPAASAAANARPKQQRRMSKVLKSLKKVKKDR